MTSQLSRDLFGALQGPKNALLGGPAGPPKRSRESWVPQVTNLPGGLFGALQGPILGTVLGRPRRAVFVQRRPQEDSLGIWGLARPQKAVFWPWEGTCFAGGGPWQCNITNERDTETQHRAAVQSAFPLQGPSVRHLFDYRGLEEDRKDCCEHPQNLEPKVCTGMF